MDDLERYQRLMRELDSARSRRERAQGGLDQLLQSHSVQSPKQLEKLLAKEEAHLEQLSGDFLAELDQVEQDYASGLEGADGKTRSSRKGSGRSAG